MIPVSSCQFKCSAPGCAWLRLADPGCAGPGRAGTGRAGPDWNCAGPDCAEHLAERWAEIERAGGRGEGERPKGGERRVYVPDQFRRNDVLFLPLPQGGLQLVDLLLLGVVANTRCRHATRAVRLRERVAEDLSVHVRV